MAKRKTINVDFVLDEANRQLARKDEVATADFKSGICIIIERILLDTGNYKGFNYNLWSKDGGSEQWFKDGEPDFPEKNKYLYSKYGGCYDRHYY